MEPLKELLVTCRAPFGEKEPGRKVFVHGPDLGNEQGSIAKGGIQRVHQTGSHHRCSIVWTLVPIAKDVDAPGGDRAGKVITSDIGQAFLFGAENPGCALWEGVWKVCVWIKGRKFPRNETSMDISC